MKKEAGKKSRVRKTVTLIVIIACVCVIAFALYKLISTEMEYQTARAQYDDLRKYTHTAGTQEQGASGGSTESTSGSQGQGSASGSTSGSIQGGSAEDPSQPSGGGQASLEKHTAPITVDFAGLKAINPDVVGWIYVPYLEISYPIVQGEDDDYYLHRTYEGTVNFAGSIFMESLNSPDFQDCNTILYGHNMKDLSMFGKLKLLMQDENYRNCTEFWVLTPEEDYCFQIFNIEYTSAYGDLYTLFSEPGQEFTEYLERRKAHSAVNMGDFVFDEDSRIVTLSTCTTGRDDGRFVVQGLRSAAEGR